MHLPPLYPITDARLELSLSAQIRRLGAAGFPLVQFRGKPLDPGTQYRELATALREAEAQGGWPAICVNDRADLAVLAAQEGLTPWGLHLGQGDLPAREARLLPGLAGLHLGTSTHEPGEWAAPDPACDHAGIGPFRATATKGDHAPPVGLEGLRLGCAALRGAGLAPVAIGGLTLADAPACFQAGAEALAMVGAVAQAAEPGDLLWQAQVERWQARPPLLTGQGVVLVGGSGAGKSSLARALAFRLGLPNLDSDHRVEAASGRTIPEVFAQEGEEGFRALEAQAVAGCLGSPAVVALGAGAWEDEATRARVRAAGFGVLWLAEVPERAWARVAGDRGRPLADRREAFMARWARRTARWAEAPLVLPLGRSAQILAGALAQG
jgi:thiamine-phosphate pyrophosphorylase